MVRFGHQGGGKNKDSKTMRIKKSNPARRKSFLLDTTRKSCPKNQSTLLELQSMVVETVDELPSMQSSAHRRIR